MRTVFIAVFLLVSNALAGMNNDYQKNGHSYFRIKPNAYEVNHPTGCVYAIVNEYDQIVSECFSDRELNNGIVGGVLREYQAGDSCHDQNH